MASFDIKSLFTSIPLEETIDIASQKYFNSIYQHRFFTRKFFGLLSLSVKDILFLFNNQLFSLVEGVFMGNHLSPSPTFANLFLCHHEAKASFTQDGISRMREKDMQHDFPRDLSGHMKCRLLFTHDRFSRSVKFDACCLRVCC